MLIRIFLFKKSEFGGHSHVFVLKMKKEEFISSPHYSILAAAKPLNTAISNDTPKRKKLATAISL